jgi:D-alanyl-D-alanine dipeptidase
MLDNYNHINLPSRPPLLLVHPGAGIRINLAYATSENFCGQALYRRSLCLLSHKAALTLRLAASFLTPQGFSLCIRDAYRPAEVQALLWEHCSDKRFVADPAIGSVHSKGIAVDVELCTLNGAELDMGSRFDEMTTSSAHDNLFVSPAAQLHRKKLRHAMTSAGFESLDHEWWHYHLPNPSQYPIISSSDLGPINPMISDKI